MDFLGQRRRQCGRGMETPFTYLHSHEEKKGDKGHPCQGSPKSGWALKEPLDKYDVNGPPASERLKFSGYKRGTKTGRFSANEFPER